MDDVLWHIEQDYPCWIRRDVCEIITGDYIPSGPLPDGRWVNPAPWAPEPRRLPDNVHPWDYCVEHNAGQLRAMDGTPDTRRPEGWHLDDGQNVLCKYGSGLATMLQQAYIEGYNPIILVGADLGYVAGENHFIDGYHSWDMPEGRAEIENDTQVDMHTHAREWCDAHGVQILNASLGGELEVYERVEFRSLFNG